VNPGDKSSEEKFKEVSEAYGVLSDPEKRKLYDQFGRAAFEQGPPPPRGGRGGPGGFQWQWSGPAGGFGQGIPNLNDLFGDLFGGRGGFGGAQVFDDAAPGEGQDIIHRVEIPLRDAVLGTALDLNVTRPVPCRTCGGTCFSEGGRGRCEVCGGTGQRRGKKRGFFAQPCEACGGTGRVPGSPCRACRGTGLQESAERLSVKVPAGVDTGSKLRVAGKGYYGERGGPPGDLFLDITVRPDGVFTREGRNLRRDIGVPFYLAVLGGRVDVETIDGQVTLTIPAGTQGGQVLRLAGKGVPRPGGGPKDRGDLLVRVNLTIPKNLPRRARELLEELAKEIK
jgi:molecular chaperone DnaJ